MNDDKIRCPNIPIVVIKNPRGNYKPLSFRFKVKDTDEYYSPAEGDDVYFTLKKNYNTDKIVLLKHLNNGLFFDKETYYFSMYFEYEDTIKLAFDKFVGDITIVRNNLRPELEAYVDFYNCADATGRSIEIITDEGDSTEENTNSEYNSGSNNENGAVNKEVITGE